jgi:MFS family permease
VTQQAPLAASEFALPDEALLDTPAPAADDTIGSFHAFRYRNFRLLWLGSAFTSAAMWIQQTTMGWVVYDLTNSGSLLGALNLLRAIPVLTLVPIAGLTADRVSRNLIIGVSQLFLATLTMLLALAIAFGIIEVWHLFLFMLLASVANSFNMPARQTMVFDVVPRNVLPNAVALNNIGGSIMRTAGPLIGGAMIVAIGAASNFAIQSCAYLGVMTTVVLIHLPARTREAHSRGTRAFFSQILDGYRYVIGTPQLRLLLVMTLINPLFYIPLHLGLLPIYAKDIFDGGGSSLGIMLGALGFGGVLGGLLTASLNRVDRRGLLQFAGLFIHGACHAAFAVVGYVTGDLWLAVPFLIAAGAAESLHMTTNQTVLQLIAPDNMRGRITAALQLSPVFMSLGIFIAGALADVVGAPAVGIAFSLAGLVVVMAIFVASPGMRRLRLSTLTPVASA